MKMSISICTFKYLKSHRQAKNALNQAASGMAGIRTILTLCWAGDVLVAQNLSCSAVHRVCLASDSKLHVHAVLNQCSVPKQTSEE